jgi:hypothetical protein
MDAALDSALSGANHLSLHTADPGASGTTAELTSGTAPGYARQALTFAAAAANAKANSNAQVFTASGGDWPAVSYVGIWNTATFIGSCALDTPLTATDGQTITIAIGDLSLAGSAA